MLFRSDGGLLSRTGNGYELRRVAVELGEPIRPAGAAPIAAVDVSVTPTGTIFASLSSDGSLRLTASDKKKNLLTGKTSTRTSTMALPHHSRADAGPPQRLLLAGNGASIYLAWNDGQVWRYGAQDFKPPLGPEIYTLTDGRPDSLTALDRKSTRLNSSHSSVSRMPSSA